ncbi:uncharacterized protein LACBIDRAFT_294574 [Laccaria bicolor S238N-H82]|uniref:Predicted protein n=1 Tax=Laccaria bicolor (strain S238N-H82 / ATCC MYA-4686) TaxID=486041 RepID=B0DE23_LACBS|nr:uncharacterized protein LACBIDRAFT_294574 [Laccaria bicolor S238N-H82]EDR07189.1 predicted protein [Laccaria bicolor S238N-H82]|eukprot:XP_001882120.1 predicted protein [Laccaria bicolor S238N-H82]
MELFQDTNSDAAMNDTDVISFQGDTYPGSDEGDPVALINATTNTAVVVDQKAEPTPDSNFMKRARLNETFSYKMYNTTWLSMNKDEIVYTDGVRFSMMNPMAHRLCSGYMVINSKGEKGFVYEKWDMSGIKLRRDWCTGTLYVTQKTTN